MIVELSSLIQRLKQGVIQQRPDQSQFNLDDFSATIVENCSIDGFGNASL